MADSFINKLDETTTLKYSDFTAFDIADTNTNSYYTKKVTFETLSKKLSTDIVTSLNQQFNTLQSNINTIGENVGYKLDKRGTDFGIGTSEKMSGPLLVNSSLSVINASYFDANVNMKNHFIINLQTPTNDYDAANKFYVDDKFSKLPTIDSSIYVLRAGDTMTGFLKLPSQDPTDDYHAVHKKYVDNKFTNQNKYLPLAGGTMEGNISLNSSYTITNIQDISNASADGDAVNYKYAKSISAVNKYLLLTGGTMVGAINMGNKRIYGIPDVVVGTTLDSDVVNKKYVDSRIPSGGSYLPLAGGTMSGLILIPTDATTNQDATSVVNKKYVDTKLPLAGGTMSGNINANTNTITNIKDIVVGTTGDGDAVNYKFVKNISTTYLPVDGGTMTGPLILAGFSEKLGTVTSALALGKTTYTFDMKTGNTFQISVPGTIDKFLTTNSSAQSYSITVVFTQSTPSVYSVSNWMIDGITVKWANNIAPQLTQTASKIDIFGFTKVGNNWFGFNGGQNF